MNLGLPCSRSLQEQRLNRGRGKIQNGFREFAKIYGSLLRELALLQESDPMRKLIDFDEDTFDKLKQLSRDRMATIQDLADEAFADLLKKHGVPIDLKDALRKSAHQLGASVKVVPLPKPKKPR
jgi:hypothetical protein